MGWASMGQKKWAVHMGHGMSHQCHQWPTTYIWASALWDSPWATWHFALSCRRLSLSKMLPKNGYLKWMLWTKSHSGSEYCYHGGNLLMSLATELYLHLQGHLTMIKSSNHIAPMNYGFLCSLNVRMGCYQLDKAYASMVSRHRLCSRIMKYCQGHGPTTRSGQSFNAI